MARSADLDLPFLEEASGWYALSLSDLVTDAELADLDNWIAADLRHERAFERVARASRQVQNLSGLAELVPLVSPASEGGAADVVSLDRRRDAVAGASSAAANDDGGRVAGSPSWRRRPIVKWGLPGALAASLALAVGIGSFDGAPVGSPVSTAIAQTRVLKLADGSRVTLGPSSRIATRIDAKGRSVTLLSGEAFFEVAHDSSRPFWVEAGDTRIQVVGTKFDVNRAGGRVSVSVLEGVVRVHEPAPLLGKSAVRVLRATQMVQTADSASLFSAPPSTAIAVDPVPAGDWRNGRLTYIDARLGDVVDDLNRYYAPGVKLADPALADVRIAMGLRPSEIDAFVEGLPLIAPVRVEKSMAGTVVIERAR
jgi:transmembrane sensor